MQHVLSKAPAIAAACLDREDPCAGSPAQIEARLERLLPPEGLAPQALHRAMRHAVFAGGKRLRPRLVLAVARACAAEEAELELALQAACAIELVHCASLVHDDLPSFDDAAERRGRPAVHVRFGEANAILAGDALLALAFEVLADAPAGLAKRALRILGLLGRAVGSREGLIGGQGLEEGPPPAGPGAPEAIARYHAMKTASLFRLAAMTGAAAAGAIDIEAWGGIGECLGYAYQLADDLYDVRGAGQEGKPAHRDAALGRPNAALLSGAAPTRARLDGLLADAERRAGALAPATAALSALLSDLRRCAARMSAPPSGPGEVRP